MGSGAQGAHESAGWAVGLGALSPPGPPMRAGGADAPAGGADARTAAAGSPPWVALGPLHGVQGLPQQPRRGLLYDEAAAAAAASAEGGPAPPPPPQQPPPSPATQVATQGVHKPTASPHLTPRPVPLHAPPHPPPPPPPPPHLPPVSRATKFPAIAKRGKPQGFRPASPPACACPSACLPCLPAMHHPAWAPSVVHPPALPASLACLPACPSACLPACHASPCLGPKRRASDPPVYFPAPLSTSYFVLGCCWWSPPPGLPLPSCPCCSAPAGLPLLGCPATMLA